MWRSLLRTGPQHERVWLLHMRAPAAHAYAVYMHARRRWASMRTAHAHAQCALRTCARACTHAHAQALNEQKAELLSKVHNLKKELQDWRSKLDVQVKTYRNVRSVGS